jgi:hypothetical protein
MKHAKEEWEQRIQELELCAEQNDCDKCPDYPLCLRKYNLYSERTRPFSYYNPTSDLRRSQQPKPKYDTTFICDVLRKYHPGMV